MQIALFNLMAQNRVDESPADILRMTTEKVRMADQAGFDATWFAEHHFSSHSVCPSPLLMAAHCAAVTTTIKLGPAVVVLPLHNPVRVAQEVGMLQALTGDRMLLGIGTGHQPHEFRTYGVPMSDRTNILIEGWDILEQGLVEGRIAYQGKHFQIPEAPLVAYPGTMPPVFLAGGEPALWQRAARSGAHIFISQGHRRAPAALPMRAKIAAGLQAGGLAAASLKLAIQRYVFVTDDKAEAHQAAAGMLRFIRTTLSLRDPTPPRDGAFMRNVAFDGEPTVDWLLHNAPIGPAQKIIDLLGEDLELLAPSHWSLYMGFSGLPAPRVLAALDRFGTHVLPTLRTMLPAQRQLAS